MSRIKDKTEYIIPPKFFWNSERIDIDGVANDP